MKRTRVERGLYRQHNGNYGIYVLADGQLRWKTVGTKLTEARRQRDLLSAKAEQGELPVRCTLTFAQLAHTWIEGFEAQVHSGERSERTLEHYHYHLKHNLLPTLGQKKVQQVSTDDCARLIAKLRAQGLSPKTIAGALVPLGRVFSLALRRGYIATNPLERLETSERPRVHRREQRVLTHNDMRKLLAACPPSYKPIIATALYTGMRLSELLGLTWAEVDFDAGLIHLRSQLSRGRIDNPARRVRLKTKAAVRDIPLLPQLGSLLRQHKLASAHSAENDYVFSTTLGTPLGYRNVEKRGAHTGGRPGRARTRRATTAPAARPPAHLRKPPHRRPPPRRRTGVTHPRTRTPQHHPRHIHAPLRPRRARSRYPSTDGCERLRACT